MYTSLLARTQLPRLAHQHISLANAETRARLAYARAATKAAAWLSALGFHAKEMIGGIEFWRREGVVEGTLGESAPLVR